MLHNGTKSDPVTPPSGGDGDENVTISLDATTKALPRLEEFVLEATVSPSGKTVTWSSSDPTIASVTADGNKITVKGLKVGRKNYCSALLCRQYISLVPPCQAVFHAAPLPSDGMLRL